MIIEKLGGDTLGINWTAQNTGNADGFVGLAIEQGTERKALSVISTVPKNGTAVLGLNWVIPNVGGDFPTSVVAYRYDSAGTKIGEVARRDETLRVTFKGASLSMQGDPLYS